MPLLLLALTAALAQPILLDAGSLVSPLMEGFTRLHQEGSDQPGVRWLTPPFRVETRGFPDPLLTDGLHGGVLHLDLPAGRWEIRVLQAVPHEDPRVWAGEPVWGLKAQGAVVIEHRHPVRWEDFLQSPEFAAAPRPRFVPGETAFDRQLATRHRWERVEVEVGADGLVLQPFGRPVQAWVIAPLAERAETEVELALIDGLREAWWQRHYAPEAHLPLPTLTLGPLGLAALDHDLDLAHPTLPPAVYEALVGEPLILPFAVLGGDQPGTIEVRAGKGVGVELMELSWLDAAGHPARTLKPRPTVAWPGPSWRGDQGLPPVLVARVEVSRPGRHRIRLRLRRGEERLDHDLMVHAAPAAVSPGIPTGLYVQLPPEAMLRGGPLLDLADDHLRLLASFGLRAVSLRYLFWDAGYPESTPVDTSRFDHLAATWASLGGELLVWADPKTALRGAAYRDDGPTLPADRRPVVQELLQAAANAPLPTFVHVYEEEGYVHADAARRTPAFAEALRALAPDVRLLGAAPTPRDWPIAADLEVLTLTGDGTDLADAARRTREAGGTPWAYNLAPGRAGPLVAWAAGVEAHLQWHANPIAADPFDAVREPARWFHTVLAPDGEHHATAMLIALSDGLYDARLLRTLEEHLAMDPGTVDPDLVRATDAFVDTVRHTLLAARLDPSNDGRLLPDADLGRIRARARALLTEWSIAPPRRPTR
jgi:hypothetical protein